MHTDIVQQLRYKLQKRFRKLDAAGIYTFHTPLVRLWQFLHGNELFTGILEQASRLSESSEGNASRIMRGEICLGNTEIEDVCLAYWVFKSFSEHRPDDQSLLNVVYECGGDGEFDVRFERFKKQFFEPLYDYIDEQLDDQRAVLGLLRRYKHHCEWFRRDELLEIVDQEKSRSQAEGKKGRGEKQLALHLYEFLHSQGLSFSIEPWSISGEPDLVAAQDSTDPLIADVKVFDPPSGRNKSYLISGFHQVYQYTLAHNEPFGYLVIFKLCEEGLAYSLSQQEQSTSFATFNGKTIFFVVIDLFAHKKSASKRGKLNSYVITEQELVTQQVDSESPQDAPAPEEIEQAVIKEEQQ